MISFYKSSSLIDASYSYERAGFQQAFLQAFLALLCMNPSLVDFLSLASSLPLRSTQMKVLNGGVCFLVALL